MKYFIHGDDFGRSPTKTSAIDRLLMEGRIQTTTLLVNMSDTDHAAELAKRNGYSEKVCLHLNFSEGEPLTEGIKKTGLCNSSGKFRWASSKRIIATCMLPKSIRMIRQEAEAQMQLFRQKGFYSHRLDSHDWLLFNYPIWIAIKPLLNQYGFTSTRMACENWIRTKSLPLRIYYRFMEKQIGKVLRMDSTWSGGVKSFQRAITRGLITPEISAEIMTHPDIVEGALVDVSNHERIPMQEVVDTLMGYAGLASPISFT